MKNLMWQEIHQQASRVGYCEEVNQSVITRIGDRWRKKKPRAIIIAARGSSNHVGVYAKYLIETRLSIPVIIAAPSVFTIYQTDLNLEDMMVIAISQSGAGLDVLEVMRAGNRQQVPTIAITNTPDSPIAREANFHLFCAVDEEKSVAATKTFTSQMLLITLMVQELTGRSENISQLRQVIEEVYNRENDLDKVAQKLRFARDAFVLGRGLTFPIALEAALKIKETCYVHASGYSLSEFVHGPFAVVDQDRPVIIYCFDTQSIGDTDSIIKKLSTTNSSYYLFTSIAKYQDDPNAIVFPHYGNVLDQFQALIIAQLVACHLSFVRGNNPDQPRGLNKVTITR